MKDKPTTKRRLSYTAASGAFDTLEDAEIRLDSTFAVFAHLVPFDGKGGKAMVHAMRRHLETDIANLRAAIGKARDVILSPLYAADFPNAHTMSVTEHAADVAASEAADAAGGLMLVVNNGGNDAA